MASFLFWQYYLIQYEMYKQKYISMTYMQEDLIS